MFSISALAWCEVKNRSFRFSKCCKEKKNLYGLRRPSAVRQFSLGYIINFKNQYCFCLKFLSPCIFETKQKNHPLNFCHMFCEHQIYEIQFSHSLNFQNLGKKLGHLIPYTYVIISYTNAQGVYELVGDFLMVSKKS